jgi:glycosyltransferase involved in cell wall biosynthesis
LRIGIYSIALNEAQFVERWSQSALDADCILVADTGSKDNTLSMLEKHKIPVASISIKPFRFDDARNAALSLLPTDLDVVIALDLDEVLMPGWRRVIENNWIEGCTRLRYKYVWSWANGMPDVTYHGDKIVGRHTHRWKHPVHEVMKPTVPEVSRFCDDLLIEHHPDSTKSRGQYLPLLELAVSEDPSDDRNAHYLGREYFFAGRYKDAIAELSRHLDLPKAEWMAERAASMRYIGKCYEVLKNTFEARYWYTVATLEDPTSREALIDAARFELAQNSFHRVIDLCERALQLPTTGGFYLSERYALYEGPYDLSSVAYFHLGDRLKAIELAEKAIELNPFNPRLKSNLNMMQG